MITWCKKQIEKYPKLWEIFKFLLIGGIATIIDFLIMAAILYAWEPSQYSHNFLKVFITDGASVWAAIIGTGVGFTIGLIFNYIFSITFVFNGGNNTTKKAKTAKGFILFALLSAIGLGIHVLGMYIGKDLLNINEWVVKVVLTILILIFNYITRKKFIFKEKSALDEQNN